jgi:hypothetical protein
MGHVSNEEYINWAVLELMNNNETKSLKILAGFETNTNQFELLETVNNVKNELNISYDPETILNEYAVCLAQNKLSKKIENKQIVTEMNKIYQNINLNSKFKTWFDLDEFFDDYYVISNENIEDVIIRECKIIIEESGKDWFPELHNE